MGSVNIHAICKATGRSVYTVKRDLARTYGIYVTRNNQRIDMFIAGEYINACVVSR